MFFEVTLMQLLNLFLGYPTYALTVTLMSLLVFTGVGALLSARLRGAAHDRPACSRSPSPGSPSSTCSGSPRSPTRCSGSPLAARVPIAFAVLAPLGLCLGMFMPLGVRAVSRLSDAPREYVAWGWAVNGFASVVGAVLATLLVHDLTASTSCSRSGSAPIWSPCVAWRRLARRAAGGAIRR